MASSKEESMPETLKVIRDKADYSAVLQAMSHTNQNVTEAANALGITRPTLYRLLERMGIQH